MRTGGIKSSGSKRFKSDLDHVDAGFFNSSGSRSKRFKSDPDHVDAGLPFLNNLG